MFGFFLDVLFPPHCVSCKEGGDWWCAECRSKIERMPASAMQEVFPDDTFITQFVATGFYHDPVLRAAIHALKYKGAQSLMPAMVEYMEDWQRQFGEMPWSQETELAIQALPCTPSRKRERGFDQAEFLADMVHGLVAPSANRSHFLGRKEGITHQASLAHGALREANAADSFFLLQTKHLPIAVVLVDDVVTTGSTMREAARILQEAGVERVYGFALAIGA